MKKEYTDEEDFEMYWKAVVTIILGLLIIATCADLVPGDEIIAIAVFLVWIGVNYIKGYFAPKEIVVQAEQASPSPTIIQCDEAQRIVDDLKERGVL